MTKGKSEIRELLPNRNVRGNLGWRDDEETPINFARVTGVTT